MQRSTCHPFIVLSAVTAALACTDAPTGHNLAAERTKSLLPVAAVSASVTTAVCPPTIPAGYVLVTCFDFTPIPGVWHGFIVGNSLPPIPPGQLSAEYVLVSPTGFERLPPNTFVDLNRAIYTFQAEFNGVTSFDVLRIVAPAGQPAPTFTIIVIKRALTPGLQTLAIATQIAQLEAAGVLGGGQANSLVAKLQNAIAKLNEGKATPAAAMLHALVNEVSALMSGPNPALSAIQGQGLIDAANAVIARLAE